MTVLLLYVIGCFYKWSINKVRVTGELKFILFYCGALLFTVDNVLCLVIVIYPSLET